MTSTCPRRQTIDVHVLPMENPSDVTALRALLAAGTVNPAEVIAVVGKSEGTGMGKDVGRETADAAVTSVFAEALGTTGGQVHERLCIVLSGGTPGVLTPHIAVFSQHWSEGGGDAEAAVSHAQAGADRLVAGIAHSAEILPEEIGRLGQVHKVADAVRDAMTSAGITDPADVHLVLVKAPALTEIGIEQARGRGTDTVTTDLGIGPHGGMCYANDGSALGVAAALGEIDSARLRDEDIRGDWQLFSSVAMTSAAGEKTSADVFLLGNSACGAGSLRIGHHPMRDILDIGAVPAAVAAANMSGGGVATNGSIDDNERSRIVYLLAKMIIPGARRLHGQRITLADDPVGYHVAKAMGGYLLAVTTGQTMCFVSGGEYNSHQGPPDGNPLAAIVRLV